MCFVLFHPGFEIFDAEISTSILQHKQHLNFSSVGVHSFERLSLMLFWCFRHQHIWWDGVEGSASGED